MGVITLPRGVEESGELQGDNRARYEEGALREHVLIREGTGFLKREERLGCLSRGVVQGFHTRLHEGERVAVLGSGPSTRHVLCVGRRGSKEAGATQPTGVGRGAVGSDTQGLGPGSASAVVGMLFVLLS